MINRIAIFIFYDKQGIVDDYVPYFLEKLKPFVNNLIVVVNGELTPVGGKKLKSITKNVFVRENIGYEPGAIKDVLFKFYGMPKMLKYDELLICNDTFYGPFFDLKELFAKMDKEECGFWGITEQAAKKGFYPKHIQSYFYNIKKELLHSKHFKNFFENLSLPRNLNQAIKNYEIAMSQFFLKTGFSYASYVNTEIFIEEDASKNFNYSVVTPLNLLEKKCPFIKKKAFFYCTKETFLQGGEQSNGLMQFIENYTKYPQKIIWQNLLRTANINDIKNQLHLQYIFPKNTLLSKARKFESKKIVVIAHLFYTDLIDECLTYLDNIPRFIDLIVITSKAEIKDVILKHFYEKRKVEIRMIENRKCDITELLRHCRDVFEKYDYLCFTYDKKEEGKLTKIEASSFRFLLWENTLASECYIKNILNKFEDEPELGFLNVPQPFHGIFFETFKNEPYERFNFEKSCFWARCKALKSASQSYYSGTVLSDSYAQIRISYLQQIIREHEKEKEKTSEMIRKIVLFAKKYSVTYIYGAGTWGKKIAEILKHFKIEYKGFIVSKKQKNVFLQKPILELNEFVFNKNIGIILGLDKDNSLEVLRILQRKNIDRNNILRIN